MENINRYTPEFITELPKNSIFVYGSNQFNRAKSGSAKTAVDKFGAIYKDVPIGLCGQSYGIITKSFNNVPASLEFITFQVQTLYYFALLRQDLIFYVTKIGTSLAGFSIEEIAHIFKTCMPFKPTNIILPIEFSKQ